MEDFPIVIGLMICAGIVAVLTYGAITGHAPASALHTDSTTPTIVMLNTR